MNTSGLNYFWSMETIVVILVASIVGISITIGLLLKERMEKK